MSPAPTAAGFVAPGTPLLWAVAGWTGLALGAVALPPLWPVLLATGGALVIVAALDAWRLLGQALPEISREIPERVFQGRSVELVLNLRNRAQAPVLVRCFDDLPDDIQSLGPPREALPLAAGEERQVPVAVCPTARGDRPLGAPALLVSSPLGFWRRRVEGAPGAVLRVSPDTSRLLRSDALDPRRLLAALGARPARRRGQGMEFESLRDYVDGDDPRMLDWAASARRGRPVVRLHRHERNHTVLIAVDTSRLMGGRVEGRSKLDYAVDAGLALAHAAILAGDRVGMAVFDSELRGYVAPRRRRRDLGEFVDLLRPAQPRLVEADFQALARGVVTRQRQRALVVILTDFVESDADAFSAPLAVLGNHHQVLLVAVRDRLFRELEPRRPVPVAPSEPELRVARVPDDLRGVYRRIVLDDLLREREVALGRLRARGLHTLDLPPEAMTASVLNRYLELRQAPAR